MLSVFVERQGVEDCSFVDPVFRISDLVDHQIPTEKCKVFLYLLRMITIACERDYHLELLIDSIFPQILKRIIEGYSNQKERGRTWRKCHN